MISALAVSLVLYLLPGRYAYPVTGRIASASANITAFFQAEPGDGESEPVVEQLRKELVLARQELAAARNEIHLLQKELESVSGVKKAARPEFASIIPARVILRRDASNFRRTVLVNRGSEDGVRPGMPVLWGCQSSEDGRFDACVVGTVNTVGPSASRVLLASDPYFRVPARILESRDRVIVEGKSPSAHPMRLKHVGIDTRVSVGDTIITSGSLGIFPPGLLIGTVVEVEGRDYAGETQVSLASLVDLDELESLVIVELAAPEIQEDDR